MSIIQVAKLAGVSPATVSRVMSNRGGVSSENVVKVQEAIDKLQYQPRQMKSSKDSSSTVALLVLSTHELFHNVSTSSQTMEGIRMEMARLGINLVVANATKPEEIPPIVINRQVKGLILQGQTPNPKVLEKIRGIPAVWLTSHHESQGDALLPGNEQIGRIAAKYLLEKGCKKPGVLNAMSWNPALNTRVQFYKYAVTQQSGSAPKCYLSKDSANDEAASTSDIPDLIPPVCKLVRQLAEDSERPDGLFVPFDLQTAIVHRELLRNGIQPGRDILLIGSDNIQSALVGLWPRPATISLRSVIVGQMAVQRLMHRIAHPNGEDDVQVSIQPSLIPGEEWVDEYAIHSS